MKESKNCLAVILSCVFLLLFSSQALAVINGPCASCHTMHNSQDNLSMRFDSQGTPLPQLLRGDCYGCHAQGLANALQPAGLVDVIPQVYHTDAVADLAGGNFAYLDDTKTGGQGLATTRGHNIDGLHSITTDPILTPMQPGGINQFGHNDGLYISTDFLTCAGDANGLGGCHGVRADESLIPYTGITGAHHDNWSGSVDPATTDGEPGHSYRFLQGVKGYEDTDWQYTTGGTSHNEYFGRTAPEKLGCGDATEITCHNTSGGRGVRAPNGTMAEFCATCHGDFHTLQTIDSIGIGASTSSPFLRHPSDLALPTSGEYAAYTTYLVNTPVARTDITAQSNGRTNTDSVFCLSCHVAHASMYPDMLKWDYAAMQVGDGQGASGTGCFACHSTKD